MGLVCVFLQKDLSGSTVGRCSVSEADRHFEYCRRCGSVGYRLWKGRKLINSYSRSPEIEFLLASKAPQANTASGFSKVKSL